MKLISLLKLILLKFIVIDRKKKRLISQTEKTTILEK